VKVVERGARDSPALRAAYSVLRIPYGVVRSIPLYVSMYTRRWNARCVMRPLDLDRGRCSTLPPTDIAPAQLRSPRRPNEPIEHVYFPQTGIVSLLAVMDDDSAVEVGTIGTEGMAGLPLFLGADMAPTLAIGQIPGEGKQMAAAAFRDAVNGSGQLRAVLERYTHSFMVQVFQGAACNRLHPLVERCARWILMTHDRAGEDEFPLTQEFLSYMLGVRRAGVSVNVSALEPVGEPARRYTLHARRRRTAERQFSTSHVKPLPSCRLYDSVQKRRLSYECILICALRPTLLYWFLPAACL